MKKNIRRKTQNLRNAGLPLARATRYAAQSKGMPAWAIGGLILGVVGAVGVISVTALGLTQDTTPTALAIPSPEEAEVLQQTASAIETITAARIAPPIALAPEPVAVPTTSVSLENTAELPEVVTRQQTSILEIASNTIAQQAAPAAPELVQTNCMADLGALLSEQIIPFGVSSTDVDVSLQSNLRTIAARASDCPNVRIVVEGHSDASGSSYDNVQLSWSRAEAVIASIDAMGFDASIYEPMGFGARFAPDLANGAFLPEDGRRVSFRLIPLIQPTAASN